MDNITKEELLELTLADEILIRTYNLFYKEKLDINAEDIELKIQCMTFFLSKYGIKLTPYFHEYLTYVKYDVDETVHSEQITKWIQNLKSKEIIESTKEIINEWGKKKITIIASNLEEYLKQFEEEQKLETFNQLCKILYVSETIIGYDFTTKTIRQNENIDLSEEKIEKHVQLIKKINDNIIEGEQQ